MAKIGMFDSGAGGLSVLREALKALPGEEFIYFCDNAYCPYGDKSAEYVLGRARSITEELLSRGAQAIVVACNTATAAAIADLRATYPVPFIGMEPAVKPAALGTKSGVIGVLATAGTLKASKYLDTRGRFEDSVKIIEHVGRGYVELVESLELEGAHAREVVAASLEPLLEAGADTIVLGCTHYPFLLPLMKEIAGGRDVTFIDPAPAVVRRLSDVLDAAGIPRGGTVGGVELLSSGPDTVLRKLFVNL